MFPHVEGQQRIQALGERVLGVAFLRNHELARCIGREPDPAGTEEACALRLEFFLELLEGAEIAGDG